MISFSNFLYFCSYVSFFISDFVNSDTASSPFIQFWQGFFYLDSFKEPAFGIADSLYCFLCFYFVGFGQDYDYLLPSNPLEFSCVRLFLVQDLSNFFKRALSAMKFPLSTDFIVYHKLCCVIIFTEFQIFKFFLYFFPDQVLIEQRIVQFPCMCGLSLLLLLKSSLSP